MLQKKCRGVALLEVLISMLLSSITLYFISMTFMQYTKIQNRLHDNTSHLTEILLLVHTLEKELQCPSSGYSNLLVSDDNIIIRCAKRSEIHYSYHLGHLYKNGKSISNYLSQLHFTIASSRYKANKKNLIRISFTYKDISMATHLVAHNVVVR